MELVIMAAGMGSRFGGLKQLEPVDENGNFIIDYSIYDAIRCGFDKIVFVIKKENFEIFDSTIGTRIKPFVKVSYVFQNNDIAPRRLKPLGTGHAVLLTKCEIKDKFAVINADDFYGYESFLELEKSLKNISDDSFSLIAFKLCNTMSNFGSVKRGICKVENGFLKNITECEILKEQDKIYSKEITSTNYFKKFEIDNDCPVSMNMFGFRKKIFEFLETDFNNFCSNPENLEYNEFFLPSVIENAIKNKNHKVIVRNTNSKWMGLTYKNDISFVKKEIQSLIEKGIYPQNLWKFKK